MIRSMTAYASRSGSHDTVRWLWEMRGVNGRGLDLRLRLPEGLDGLDTTVRSALKGALGRGNVTVSLRLNRDERAEPLEIDASQLDRVLDALDRVQERAFEKGVTLAQPTAADVLSQRGVLVSQAPSSDTGPLVAALATDLGPLLAEFTAMRTREGEALQEIIAGQLDQITALIDRAAEAAEARKPQVRKALRDAFERVLAEITEADEGRLAQELALIASKQDVTEEIDRLRAHVGAAWEMLEDDKAVGRKLDFLSQEFNREANTLCSKSQNAALTGIGLELKAVIDQMREQVQNVE